MSKSCDKRPLKKQNALMDGTGSSPLPHRKSSGISPTSGHGNGDDPHDVMVVDGSRKTSVSTTVKSTSLDSPISIISSKSEPALAKKRLKYQTDDRIRLSDTKCLSGDLSSKSPMEAMSMLDEKTVKHTNGRRVSFLAKIRSFSKFRSLSKLQTSETLDSYVVEDQDYGPVCLIQDSPNRIFKCAQNGNAKEVTRILKTDPTRLHARNSQGQMPLHVAAARGRLNIVEIFLEQNVDIDAVDSQGNSALHLAALASAPDVVSLLLKNGADPNIRNMHHMMVIHVAAELPDKEVVKILLENDVDSNSRGESGWTALHYAAAKDNGDIMRLMMEKGGKPCVKCDYGYYPIHIAAKHAAANAMEAIIEQALTKGYTREEILSFKDRENNLPLHAAVNGGDIKAVTVCLKAGASVKAQQDDGSTPLHFACAQGNMEMIHLMETTQPDNFLAAVFASDAMKMTPLHRAALFNHLQVMQYLLDHGADIDCRDMNERTPLLLAASKGCWTGVRLLIAKGADVRVKDKNNRNLLHLGIKFGGKLEQICGTYIKDVKNLQNERDDFGCTPLHYASKEGHLLALDDLIRMGAVLNLKNNQKQSPFHFAARYGRYNTCRRLLDSVHGPNFINETDGCGLTALHIAAQNGHTKIIQLLLERGAVVSKDNEDNTALHHAAAHGWTHSMKILLSVHCNLRDAINIEGDTALHVAAKNGQTTATTLLLSMDTKITTNYEGETFLDTVIQNKHSEVAVATVNHDRWEEILQMTSSKYCCHVLGLIQHLPDVMLKVLDRCQVPSEDDPRSHEYHINYNFRYLDTPTDCLEKRKEKKDSTDPSGHETVPMMSLNAMVKNNRVECLSHPVCVTFLRVKWNTYGMKFYTFYLLIYTLFLASLTSFVINHNSLRHYDEDCEKNSTMEKYLYGNKKYIEFSPLYVICLWFIEIYSVLNMVKEVVQIITQKSRYFSDIGNALEWVLYVTSLLFATPFLFHMSLHWQWEAGAVAVFLAWFNCLVFLQRFDFFGIYVVMFLEILRTLVQVLCVFSILIIAFGLAFFMLLFKEESKAYSTPGLSFLRTFMMMLELDYMASFNDQFVDGREETLHFGNLTLVLLTVFVLLMPILLMNLLIGLAVGDIEAVQRNARLKRLAMQVELHTDMESKMPMFIHRRVTLNNYKQYPNKCKKKLENFFSMLSGSTFDGKGKAVDAGLCHESYMFEEMYKQKVRMREMDKILNKNNLLLRKIMQKMEIHTEDEAWDEGAGLNSDDSGDEMKNNGNLSKNKSFKEKMYLKSAVLSMWKKGSH